MSDIPQELNATFRELHGHAPDAVVRAPGRVNLIGEHTDYSNLPVLPIAIAPSVYVAATASDQPGVRASSPQFGPPVEVHADAAGHPEGWAGYLAGALAELGEAAAGRGADLLIHSDLPATGGLSSSSALTMGVLAALNQVWKLGLSLDELVERGIRAERQVGVESGGMDQTVIAFAAAGAALRIDFVPPARRNLLLPGSLRLLVASSGQEASKGGSARNDYNERVIGARLAAAMLCDQMGLDIGNPPLLWDVAGLDVVDILVDDLPEKISAKEVAHGVDADVAMLIRLTADTFDQRAKVPVRRVARHILTEALRVEEAEAALAAGDLEAFGAILNASHNSLREDFRCSTSRMDTLCAAMRKAGAYGARLTGAGFGGFAMAAVAAEHIEAVLAAAEAAGGGPAFEVSASGGLELL